MEKSRNINIDVVRIFAATMVLTVHISQYVGFSFGIGAKGVQVFFVLCGYWGFFALDKNDFSVKQYYKNRVIRIIPTYWLSLLIVMLLDSCLELLNKSTITVVFSTFFLRFLRYALMIQCFTPTRNWEVWNNYNALWTMSSFAFFYLIAPFLFRITKTFKKSMILLLGWLIVTPILVDSISRVLVDWPTESQIVWFANSNPLTNLYSFMLGGVLYLAIKENRGALYAFLLIIVVFINSNIWCIYDMLATLMIYSASQPFSIIANDRIKDAIEFLAKGSFSLYLIHPIVLKIIEIPWIHLNIDNIFLHAVYMYTITLISVYIIYYVIIHRFELIILKWINMDKL